MSQFPSRFRVCFRDWIRNLAAGIAGRRIVRNWHLASGHDFLTPLTLSVKSEDWFRLWFHPPWRECAAFCDVVRWMKRPAIGRELRNIAGVGRNCRLKGV